MDISHYLARAARYWPHHTAVLDQGRRITFRELDRRVNRLANALLGLGLAKGERVAIHTQNRAEIIEVESALYRAGLVKAPINARLSAGEVEAVLADSGASAMIASRRHIEANENVRISLSGVEQRICLDGPLGSWTGYEQLLDAASDRAPEVEKQASDLAVLHYTSGSTGGLKAAMQTFGSRQASLNNWVLGHSASAAPKPGDVMALLGPMTHASGMLIQPFLSCGVTLMVFPKFDVEEFLAAVQRERVTHAFMVPTMLAMLLAHPRLEAFDLSSLRSLAYGAAPTPQARILDAWERVGPVLNQDYGAGETTGRVVHMSVEAHAHAIRHCPERLLACGRAFGETEVRVVDDSGNEVEGDAIGEVVMRGPSVFAGYWNAPDLTAECMRDGWWHSGDLARVDEEGFIYIVDRKKDMIISGGFNVYTTEVERALAAHPAVRDVCVFGVPDEKWGEAVRAAVVCAPDARPSEAELIAFCARGLAEFKKPRGIDFHDELPKNQNGKVARKALRDPYWAGRARKVG